MRKKITWNNENIAMPAIDFAATEAWLDEVARRHGYVIGKINYIFTDDAGILAVNRSALGHDYYTDIITFDYTSGDTVGGDIYISLDTVASNAEAVGATYTSELHRVIAHGLLHLCGINDKGPGEREIMESHENEALALLDPSTIS